MDLKLVFDLKFHLCLSTLGFKTVTLFILYCSIFTNITKKREKTKQKPKFHCVQNQDVIQCVVWV